MTQLCPISRIESLFSVAVLAIACESTDPLATHPTDVPTTDDPCAGTVEAVPPELIESDNPALLATAMGKPGEGKLCLGQVFEVIQRVPVYRVWDRSKSYSKFGSWWSLMDPEGPRETYRIQNAICPEWSPLDVISECWVKVGTEVAIGPGQSADCNEGVAYEPSPTQQVYIPNNTRAEPPVVLVEDCTDGIPWP